MDKVAAEALEDDIAAWCRNLERLKKGDYLNIGFATTSCAMCAEFRSTNCEGCPVYKKTGKNHCFNTPLHDTYQAFAALHLASLLGNDVTEAEIDLALKTFENQIDFLESLRDTVSDE